ncbi:FtsW/RodA/SpoVE family cell cycle protein [Candidatus Wolfebacteria bacterium]|nr:FtsW/RodA/SpoVE family cell cycle protein [Candidatus Wolfebacteria bacterium]
MMLKKFNKFGKTGHHPDYIFLLTLLILVIFGLIILTSASSDLGKIKFNDTYYYVKHQIVYGLSLGLIGFLLGIFFHYRHFQKIAAVLLLVSLILLVLVFTPLGYRHAGANRWLNFGPFSFQPAEILKFTFVIYISAWLASKRGEGVLLRQKNFWAGYLPFLIISGIVAFLIFIQPSTTTVFIIMTSAILIYFISGARLSYVLGTIALTVLTLALLIYFTPYRFERFANYWNRFAQTEQVNNQNQGYHLNQALIAIGSGGLTGVGFGKSTTKFKYLPEPIGDSIFAVLAEELGFIGAIVLLGIFIILFLRGFQIAKKSRDQFAKLTTIGFISVMAIQTFIHIGAISGVLPLTGVPLPFISYGGTSLAIFLTMAGVIGNISKYT